MANHDEEIPIHQDLVNNCTMDCDYEYDSDYDEELIDALLNLEDDCVPVNGNAMKLTHEELHSGRNVVLEPEDIVCGGMPGQVRHRLGDVMMELIVSEYVLPYGLATTEPKRQSLLAEIYSRIELTSRSAGQRPPRYVVLAVTSDGLPYYQAASPDAITEGIKCSIKSHFNVFPTPNDVLFGRGKPCVDFPGNVRLRTFIDNQRRHYAGARATDRQRLIQVARDNVTAVGGHFLLPFNKARPSEGCVEASEEAIKKKIAHLYRESPNLLHVDPELAEGHLFEDMLLPETMVAEEVYDWECEDNFRHEVSTPSNSDQSIYTADSLNTSSSDHSLMDMFEDLLHRAMLVEKCAEFKDMRDDEGLPEIYPEGEDMLPQEVLAEDVPELLHSYPEVAPISGGTKDAGITQSLSTPVKRIDGASTISPSGPSIDTTASSCTSSARLIMKLKPVIFKWRTVLLCLTIVMVGTVIGISVALTSRNEG